MDYGRISGVSFGAYYLSRAQGELAFALFLSNLPSRETRSALSLPSLTAPIGRIEEKMVTAYAKPGSTAQHTNFIIANSSLKLATELNLQGMREGALWPRLSVPSSPLGLATLPPPSAERETVLANRADEWAKTFASSGQDHRIGEAFVEKARIALEKSQAGGEAGDRERLRAATLLELVAPRYVEIMKGLEK